VLGAYARAIGVPTIGGSLVAEMKKALAVGVLRRVTVTANHGCDGYGGIFPVGGRTLYAGETVGVKVPARWRACAPRAAGCHAVALVAHAVFPTNCWNLNTGTIPVLVYVHRVHHKAKPKPKPKPKLADPAASAALSCTSGGVVVTLSNGATATAPASFEVNGVAYGPVAAGATQAVTIAIAAGSSTELTVSSGGRVLIDGQAFTNTCTTAPSAVPSATAAVNCAAGGVVVTLSNGASATDPASFSVNGTDYGPVAPGTSETATVTAAAGTTVIVTVISGYQVLIDNQPYTNSCTAPVPKPSAIASLTCGFTAGTLTVTLSNGSLATAPASFTVSTSENGSVAFGPDSYGPIAPGADQAEQVPVDDSGYDLTLTVTSGGTTILTQTFAGGCPPATF
jgi:hypothetical protein